MIFIIGISTFVCISLGMLGLYWLLYKPQSAATERLRRLGGTQETITSVQSVTMADDSAAVEIAQRLAQPLNKLLPASASEAHKLQKKLMHAGYRSPEAPIIYRGIQLVSMAGFPLLVAGVCALTGRAIGNALIYIIIAFVVGFMLPRFSLNQMIKKRQRLIRWGLADALDLMVV